MREDRRALLLIASLFGAPASAEEPFMWGVGPRVGTHIAPLAYPSAWPAAQQEFQAVTWDLMLGLDAMIQPVEHHRARLLVTADFGRRWTDGGVLATYNYVFRFGDVQVPLGGGLGVGSARLGARGDDVLRMSYIPFRAEAGVLHAQRSWAWQAMLFAEPRAPISSVVTDTSGDRTPLQGPVWASFGIELTAYFGDFQPPRVQRAAGRAETPD